MNDIIARALAQSLINLDYITVSAGCVQEALVSVRKGKKKKIPVAKEVFSNPSICDVDTDYKDRLIPNSSEIGILYFEDLGSKQLERGPRMEKWRGTLKLVCWVQTKEVCDNVHTLESIEDIVCNIRDAVNQEIVPSSSIFKGHINVTEEYPKRPSPFDKYGYDENETQYLMPPYDYFSLKVEYTVFTKCNCGTGEGPDLEIPENGQPKIVLYSLTETKTGLVDFDGKDLYTIGYLIDQGGPPVDPNHILPLDLVNVDRINKIEIQPTADVSGQIVQLSKGADFEVFEDNGADRILISMYSHHNAFYVSIYYTKI